MKDPAQLLSVKLMGCCTQPKIQATSALGILQLSVTHPLTTTAFHRMELEPILSNAQMHVCRDNQTFPDTPHRKAHHLFGLRETHENASRSLFKAEVTSSPPQAHHAMLLHTAKGTSTLATIWGILWHHICPTSQLKGGCEGVGRQALVSKEKKPRIVGKSVGP